MAKPILVDQDFQGTQTATNLRAPSGAADAATKAYVDATVEGLAWKDSVRAASTANVTLTGPGTTIDGVTMANNDRVLLKDQTTQSQNGIYIYNGSAVAMTRAADANTFAELEAAVVVVEEGTANGGSTWRQTQANGVIDTNNIAFTPFITGAAAATESAAGIAEIATQSETDAGTDDQRFVTPLKLKTSKLFARISAFDVGDGSATSFNCDHNFNTRDCIVTVRKTSGNYDDVIADVTRPSTNRVTVTFGSAPASGAYRVIIAAIPV